MESLEIKIIGYVRSPHTRKVDIPKGLGAKHVAEGIVEVLPQFEDGLKDIDGHIGNEYRRVRIGIGHPGEKSLVNKYVLGDFNKKDLIITTSFIKTITSQIDSFVVSLHKNLPSETSLLLKMSSKIE